MKKSINLLAVIGTLSILLTSCNVKTSSGSLSQSSDQSSAAPSSVFSSSSEAPKPVTYTITWKNYDGKVLEIDENVQKDTTPTYDGLTPSRASDAQFTYIWTGWTPEVKPVTGNTEYIATFKTETNKYTVTWKNEDGIVLKSEDVFYGTTPTYDGETPTKASTAEYDYTFDKWSPNEGPITGNTTYVASFKQELRKYKVTWKDEDGTVLKEDEVPYGTVPSYGDEVPVKESTAEFSYVFDKWSPSVTSVTGDAEYTASYNSEIRKYTVTWVNYDGSTLEVDSDVLYGTVPTYDGQEPVRNNKPNAEFTFKGWSPEIKAVTGDTTYVAEFTSKGTFIFDLANYEPRTGYTLSDVNGAPWINSNIRGELDKIKKPSLKEDFYASVNYETLKNGDGGAFNDCETATQQAFEAIYNGDAVGETTNGDALKAAKDYFKNGSIEYVSAYFNEFDFDSYINSKAIFGSQSSLMKIGPTDDGYKISLNDGYFNGNYSSLPFAWIFGNTTSAAKSILKILSEKYGLDYSSSDIASIQDHEYEIFYKIYSDAYSGVNGTTTYKLSQLPWSQVKNALTDVGLLPTTRITFDKIYANALNMMFNNSSAYLEDMVITRLAYDMRFFVDLDTYKQINQYISQMADYYSGEANLYWQDDDQICNGMLKSCFSTMFEQAYVEINSSEEIKQEVADLIDDILAEYKTLADNSWLGAMTKFKMKRKLEKMDYTSCYPEYYSNFGKVAGEGLTFQNGFEIYKAYINEDIETMLISDLDELMLFNYMRCYTVNAFYSPGDNSFVILNALASGMLGDSIEEKYGMLAMVIGHEITHAFDSSGSQYDENGRQNDWWTADDKTAFNNRVNKLIAFYNQIELKKNYTVDGDNVDGEATADLGGMKIALQLAKKVENFNYDKFFKAYAYMWVSTPVELSNVESRAADPHPFNYLRVNVVVSQFDEFVETYGIEPGDAMYVPEEQRIKIW